MINYGKAEPRTDAKRLTFSQFCMAAMNESILINVEKLDRAFDLFDIVSRYLVFSYRSRTATSLLRS